MKLWLTKHWFKVCIALAAFIIGISFLYYFVILAYQKEVRIAEQNKENELRKNQEQIAENQINECISDAYIELKTLQNNFYQAHLHACIVNPELCRYQIENNSTEKAQKEAFAEYEKEWVPQCKLGKRVFLDYDPMTVQGILNADDK